MLGVPSLPLSWHAFGKVTVCHCVSLRFLQEQGFSEPSTRRRCHNLDEAAAVTLYFNFQSLYECNADFPGSGLN